MHIDTFLPDGTPEPIAPYSHVARAGMTRVAMENLVAVLNGKPPVTCVNPEVFS